jgi:hypothetical protein
MQGETEEDPATVCHLYRVQPAGLQRLEWRAYDGNGRFLGRALVWRARRSASRGLEAKVRLAGCMRVVRYRGVARLSEVACHLAELQMQARDRAKGA